METKTKRILTITNIVVWIVFVLLCFKTGVILSSYFVSLYFQNGIEKMYLVLDLTDLYRFDLTHYSTIMWLIALVWGLQAFLFYLLIKILMQLNIKHPFNTDVAVLISQISYVAFGIGAFTVGTAFYCQWLTEQGVTLPDLSEYVSGATEFFLLGAIVFIIAQIFKRGIEIQSENELTV